MTVFLEQVMMRSQLDLYFTTIYGKLVELEYYLLDEMLASTKTLVNRYLMLEFKSKILVVCLRKIWYDGCFWILITVNQQN